MALTHEAGAETVEEAVRSALGADAEQPTSAREPHKASQASPGALPEGPHEPFYISHARIGR
jgi:hypothetical protein